MSASDIHVIKQPNIQNLSILENSHVVRSVSNLNEFFQRRDLQIINRPKVSYISRAFSAKLIMIGFSGFGTKKVYRLGWWFRL